MTAFTVGLLTICFLLLLGRNYHVGAQTTPSLDASGSYVSQLINPNYPLRVSLPVNLGYRYQNLDVRRDLMNQLMVDSSADVKTIIKPQIVQSFPFFFRTMRNIEPRDMFNEDQGSTVPTASREIATDEMPEPQVKFEEDQQQKPSNLTDVCQDRQSSSSGGRPRTHASYSDAKRNNIGFYLQPSNQNDYVAYHRLATRNVQDSYNWPSESHIEHDPSGLEPRSIQPEVHQDSNCSRFNGRPTLKNQCKNTQREEINRHISVSSPHLTSHEKVHHLGDPKSFSSTIHHSKKQQHEKEIEPKSRK